MPHGKKTACTLLIALTLASCSRDREAPASAGPSIENIYAPVVTGQPPSDAFIGLSLLPNGEIRHYNYGAQRQGREPFYIASHDHGLTWTEHTLPAGFIGADVRSPVSGEYIRLLVHQQTSGFHDNLLIPEGERAGVFVARSEGGPDGKWTLARIWPESINMLKPPVFIRGGQRVIVPGQFLTQPAYTGSSHAGVFYSDDDGQTWERSNLVTAPAHEPGPIDKGPRWQNGALEPTVVELDDGRLWMLARTSQDNLYETFSEDGGETWSPMRPSRFYSTLTMPTLGRLADGRILLLWNNSTPLPEIERSEATRFVLGTDANDGVWEDVFTNRDVFHAAISDDDGQSWTGFRELLLNPRRYDADYALTGGVDRSLHQSQFVEVANGKVLISVGQHWLHRSLVVFDVGWLYEKARSSNFANGLDEWSTQKYVAGIRGHCAFNRKHGAQLIDHPDKPGAKALHVRRPEDASLVTENDGAVWNFPAGAKGSLTVRIKVNPEYQGGRISLLDRWVNPTDVAAHNYAMFNWDIDLTPGSWHELRFTWDGLADVGSDMCSLYINGAQHPRRLPLKRSSVNGLSYVHFLSTSASPDPAGFVIESVAASVQ